MARSFKEYAESGELEHLSLSDNLQLLSTQDSALEGTFFRVGKNGLFSLYRAPNQDVTWTDSDNTLVALTTTPNSLLSVLTTADVGQADGSYSLSFKLQNTTNSTRTVTIGVLDDGVVARTTNISVLKSVTSVDGFSGVLSGTIANGSTVTVEFLADNTGVNLLGSELVTSFELVKAQSAPVISAAGDTLPPYSQTPADDDLALIEVTSLGEMLKITFLDLFNYFNTSIGTEGAGNKNRSPSFYV